VIHQWHFRGKDYKLDTAAILRLAQKSLIDRVNISRSERHSIARVLDQIILRVVDMEQEYITKQLKTIEEGGRLEDLSQLVLYEIVIPPNHLEMTLKRLRDPKPVRLSEMLSDESYGEVTATTTGFVVTVYESEEQIRVRTYFQLSKPA
jgi:hypothetical protein